MSDVLRPEIQTLHEHDFVLGMLNAADALRPGIAFNSWDRRLDLAFEEASDRLDRFISFGEITDVKPRFRIRTDKKHGRSDTVQAAMDYFATHGLLQHLGKGLFVLDRGEEQDPEVFHEYHKIPSSFDTYHLLAGKFVSKLSGISIQEVE